MDNIEEYIFRQLKEDLINYKYISMLIEICSKDKNAFFYLCEKYSLTEEELFNILHYRNIVRTCVLDQILSTAIDYTKTLKSPKAIEIRIECLPSQIKNIKPYSFYENYISNNLKINEENYIKFKKELEVSIKK